MKATQSLGWDPATAEHTPNSALYNPDAPMGPRVERLLTVLMGGGNPTREHTNAILIARAKGYVTPSTIGVFITDKGLSAIKTRIAALHA